MAVEIKQCLEREYELLLTAQDIRNLTIAKLNEYAAEFENKASDESAPSTTIQATPKTGTKQGLELMMKVFGEEADGSLPLIHLPSLVQGNDRAVFMVPGIEGSAKVMLTLAKHLKSRAQCLQLSIPQQGNTAKEMAELMLPHFMSSHPVGKPFNIVGYSFGALPLLELALLLEERQLSGKIVLVDGAPELIRGLSITHISGDSKDIGEDQLQIQVLVGLINILAPGDNSLIQEKLMSIKSWRERVTTLIQMTPDLSPDNPASRHSTAYKMDMCDALLIRTKILMTYDTSTLIQRKIRSPITLIKPTAASLCNVKDDYGLSDYSTQSIDIRFVEGNHASILENPECAEHVNQTFGFF